MVFKNNCILSGLTIVLLISIFILTNPARVLAAVTPTPTPLMVIEAENYSAMSGVGTENCSEGGKNVGWIDTGDWMEYAVNILSSGSYRVEYRIASPYCTGKLDFRVGGATLTTTTIPNTGGWQSWKTVSANVNLNSGVQIIRLLANGDSWNINWFSLTQTITTVTPIPTPLLKITRLTPIYPDGASGFTIGSLPGYPITVRLTDAEENGLAGESISWSNEVSLLVNFEGYSSITDFNGIATLSGTSRPDNPFNVSDTMNAYFQGNAIYQKSSCIFIVSVNSGYGGGFPPHITPTPTPPYSTLLSRGKFTCASSCQAGNEDYKGNDGDTSTRWAASSGSFPQWWKVDLGASKRLTRVNLNWFSSINRSYKYKIEVSNDDVSFVTVIDKTGNTTFGDTSDRFNALARYVRITVTGSTSGWASFYECEVYFN